MRKLSLALAGAAALASASAAQATITVVDAGTNVDVTRVHNDVDPNRTSYINYQSPDPLPAADGSFSDMLTFYNDTACFYNLSVLAQFAADGTAAVNFTTLTLSGAGVTGGVMDFAGPVSNGTANTYAISNIALGIGTYTINLAGTANSDAAFQGTVKFNLAAAGVPEPATWGLMLLGFGLMGSSMRRRRARTALPQLA